MWAPDPEREDKAEGNWQGDDPDPVAVTREPVLKVAAVAGALEAPACYKDKLSS